MNYKFTGFSPKANSVINYAITQASALGHSYIGSEHLLLGLIKESGGMAGMLLRQRGVSEEEVREKLVETVGKGVRSNLTPDDFTPRGKRILEIALLESRLTVQERKQEIRQPLRARFPNNLAPVQNTSSGCYSRRARAMLSVYCVW